MRWMRLKTGLLCLIMLFATAAEALAYRGDWDPPARGEREYQRSRDSQRPVPPPGQNVAPQRRYPATAPGYRPPAPPPGQNYRTLPPYPPNWRAPGALPAGYRPAYPPPPNWRPYPPPPGFPAGQYPPRYYPGYRPPVLVVGYPGYTVGQVIAGALVVGMIIAAISESATPMVVNNVTYYYDGDNYYEPVTDGLNTVYKVVEPPQ